MTGAIVAVAAFLFTLCLVAASRDLHRRAASGGRVLLVTAALCACAGMLALTPAPVWAAGAVLVGAFGYLARHGQPHPDAHRFG